MFECLENINIWNSDKLKDKVQTSQCRDFSQRWYWNLHRNCSWNTARGSFMFSSGVSTKTNAKVYFKIAYGVGPSIGCGNSPEY